MITAAFAPIFAATTIPMPPADPLGYPIPIELLRALSYFTLVLHFLAMNFTLGGVGLLLYLKLRRPAHHQSMERYLGNTLPLGFSYLVTLGVPPLLFVQVMYGQLFYSSSVVIGAHWIMVVPLLIIAYGLFYLHRLTRDTRPQRQGLWLTVGFAAMLLVGFFWVNNITLSQTPDKWLEAYAAHPAGMTLNLSEATLFPRYSLFMVSPICVSALGLLIAGAFLRRWGQSDKGKAYQGFALRAFVVGLVIAAVAGGLTFATLPAPLAEYAGCGVPALLLAGGAGLLPATAAFVILAGRSGRVLPAIISAVVLTLALASFVALRDLVRIEYLRPYFDASEMPVNTQWTMFFMFLVIMLLGVALLIFLTALVGSNLARGYREQMAPEGAGPGGQSQGGSRGEENAQRGAG